MQLNAYVLGADPTWLEDSVSKYLNEVDRLVVVYDPSDRGFTGHPIPATECARRLQALGPKVELLPLEVAGKHADPIQAELEMRNAGLVAASDGATWVIQLDTDEVMVDFGELLRLLDAAPASARGVQWPMRTLYRRLVGNWYLEICSRSRSRAVNEYPGAIAVRAGTEVAFSRFPSDGVISPAAGSVTPILHNSWGREPDETLRKVRTWSHSSDEMVSYYYEVWLPSRWRWPTMRNFHPLNPRKWPALRPVHVGSL